MALGHLPDYPWDSIAPYRERAAAYPGGLIDLSVGSPTDPTPEIIREALTAATDSHAYPTTAGTEELRSAIVRWYARRRGVSSLTEQQVIPTIGSKELVALLPFMLGIGAGESIVHPRIAYPTYAMGAALCGATAVAEDDPDHWPANTKLVWVNSPSNPDGRILGFEALARIVERARAIGAVVVGDECYAEFAWREPFAGAPTPCLLDDRVTGGDLRGVLAAYSLSKQSNMAGYRAAFVAGDRDLISRLTTVRKHAGMIVPGPLQHAMAVAVSDDEHVTVQRDRYRERHAILAGAVRRAGLQIEGDQGGLYVWASAGESCWDTLQAFAELGILAAPGAFYGDAGALFIRLSAMASTADVHEAARRLQSLQR